MSAGPVDRIGRRAFLSRFNFLRRPPVPPRDDSRIFNPRMTRRSFTIGAAILAGFLKVAGIGGAVSAVQGCVGGRVSGDFEQQRVRSHRLPGSLYDPRNPNQGDPMISVSEKLSSFDLNGRSISVKIGVPVAASSGYKARLPETEGGQLVMLDYRDYLLKQGVEEGSPGFGLVSLRSKTMRVDPGDGSRVEMDVWQYPDSSGGFVYGIKKPNDPTGKFLQVDPITEEFIREDGTKTDKWQEANVLYAYTNDGQINQWQKALVFARVVETETGGFQYQRDEAGEIEYIPIDQHPEKQIYAYLDAAKTESSQKEVAVIIPKIVVTTFGKEVVFVPEEGAETGQRTFKVEGEDIILPLDEFVEEGGYFSGTVKTFYQVDPAAHGSEENFSFDTYFEWMVG